MTGKFLFCIALACGCVAQAAGQLTARNADGKTATTYFNAYNNKDTIFVFNQTSQAKTGNLTLNQLNDSTLFPAESTFRWYRFDYNDKKFEDQPFFTNADTATSQANLAQGGYKVTVTLKDATAPRDSFVAWLYMNPGFDFTLLKDGNGEVLYNYKKCDFTDFILRPNTVQSSFAYYNPADLQRGAITFENKITFKMRPGNGAEITTPLNTQGDRQYLRDYNPPYEDTQYDFTASDMFGIEKKDEVKYVTIIPHAELQPPVLPEKDPASAPVPVKFTSKVYNTAEYVWRFGNGDSVMYNLETLPPDTVRYTYYTPRKDGYSVSLTVTSMHRCTYTTEPVKITVDNPLLETGNVFTPNDDGLNDYFKPLAVSLRGFEISIYTRGGKRVYFYKGNDLRDWIGWDGRIEKTGNKAAEGVYFYIIKAMGWDEPATKNPPAGPYKGSFHLYR